MYLLFDDKEHLLQNYDEQLQMLLRHVHQAEFYRRKKTVSEFHLMLFLKSKKYERHNVYSADSYPEKSIRKIANKTDTLKTIMILQSVLPKPR